MFLLAFFVATLVFDRGGCIDLISCSQVTKKQLIVVVQKSSIPEVDGVQEVAKTVGTCRVSFGQSIHLK